MTFVIVSRKEKRPCVLVDDEGHKATVWYRRMPLALQLTLERELTERLPDDTRARGKDAWTPELHEEFFARVMRYGLEVEGRRTDGFVESLEGKLEPVDLTADQILDQGPAFCVPIYAAILGKKLRKRAEEDSEDEPEEKPPEGVPAPAEAGDEAGN